jgi:serine protease
MTVQLFNRLYILMNIKNKIFLWGFVFFLAMLLQALSQTTPSNIPVYEEEFFSDRVIFRVIKELSPYSKADTIDHYEFTKTLSAAKASSIKKIFPNHQPPASKYHPSGAEYVDLSLIYEMELSHGQSLEAAIQSLYSSGLVVYAEPRYIPTLLYELEGKGEPVSAFNLVSDSLFVPNDSLLSRLYYLDNIRAYAAWAIAQGDTNTVIAIVDTGNDFYHPDLQQSVKYNYNDPVNGEDSDQDGYIDNFYGWDLGENNNYPQYNKAGHGVHVSGTAAATVNNGLGIAGTGFHSRYLPVKVDDEFGRLVRAYEGIVYAADQGASVINCSWGGHLSGGAFGSDVVRYATINRDALIVAGAGNAGNDLPFYPASYDLVMGIAATDSLDIKWERSSYGRHISLSAPGVRILSTWPDTMYILSSGTSMSAPVVAGAAAIVRSNYPDLSAMQIAARLKQTADIIDTIPGNEAFAGRLGGGRLNMFRALNDTFTPYIRIADILLTDDEVTTIMPGTSFTMAIQMQNMLETATNLVATISTNSPYITTTDSLTWIGSLQSLEITDNRNEPFGFDIKPSIPINHEVLLTVTFTDQDSISAGKHTFSMVFNRDYQNVSSGNLKTTITSRGTVGYNYPNYFHGMGLSYNNNYTRIKCAGLVYGNSPDKVVDNIYGEEENSFNRYFVPVLNIKRLPVPAVAATELYGIFTDQAAGPMSFDITTNHHTYFWDQEDMDGFFIKEYQLINTSNRRHNGLYAGFFVDWTSRDNKRMVAKWDKKLMMAYSYLTTPDDLLPDLGNPEDFAALQVFSEHPVRHYAFDNDGYNGSIRINNGFDNGKKIAAMTSQRDAAGSYRRDNDVSSMITAGPVNLMPGDTLKLAVALLMAPDQERMYESAAIALDIYNRLILKDGTIDVKHAISDAHLAVTTYPNPFRSFFHVNIRLPAGTHSSNVVHEALLSLFDLTGTNVLTEKIDISPWEVTTHTIDTSHIKPGIYLMTIASEKVYFYDKLLKYETSVIR